MHRKTPSAFKKNIETEMEHGKPQKQAVAIAYSVKRGTEHHKMADGGCIGLSCKGCSSGNCYAKGGKIGDEFEPRETRSAMDPEKHQKGVHESSRFGSKGISMAGEDQRTGLDSKEDHKRVLGELKRMKKPNLYANGGEVRGVHEAADKLHPGRSVTGNMIREARESPQDRYHDLNESAHNEHVGRLDELKSMKKPHLYAEGGSVDSWTKRSDNERGVHGDAKKGMSTAGHHVRNAQEHPEDREDSMGAAKLHHMKNLDEMRGMPKPKLYAEGGEVADGEPEMEDELKHAMGGELMDALERKDRKGIMSSLEAIVLSCRGKE